MILLVDMSNLAYRALHTFHLSYAGRDVSVVYGTLRILAALIIKHKPRSVVACFDGGTPLFRLKTLPQYKQNRRKDSSERDWDDVFRQFSELEEILSFHGVLVLRKRYIEADDLLYWAAVHACDYPTIVTTDGDLYQALDYDGVQVLNPRTGFIYDAHEFELEFGYDVHWHVLYKVLVGDGSDNVPGVSSIGPKTAVKLINEFVRLLDMAPLVAVSHIPEGKWASLNIRQQKAIKDHSKIWQACWDVMDLSVDRTGAKHAISKARWQRAQAKRIKRYYMDNGFMSFISDGDVVRAYNRLLEPEFVFDDNTCLPVVPPKRTPIGGHDGSKHR